MPKLIRLSLFAGLIAPAAPALAQNTPTRTLSKPDAEYSEPFTQIQGLRELRDGRVVVVDPRDKTVQVVNMQTGTATKLGREGSGPGEYGMPLRLLSLPNDTSAVVDMLNNRILLINPNATVGGFVDLNVSSGGGGGRILIGGGNQPQYSDSKGRFYMEGPPFLMTDAGPVASDSVPMIRWDRATGKRDTLSAEKAL